MIKIENTRNWSWDRMRSYWNDIDSAINKYINKFSDNVCYNDVINDISRGDKDLWVCLRNDEFIAFAIIEIITTYTNKKRLNICHFGGKLDAYVDVGLDVLEAYARQQGVTQIQFAGRKGWCKMLVLRNYRVIMMDYRKDIDCGQQVS